jgi:hypothetical protein
MKRKEKLAHFLAQFSTRTEGAVGECACGIFHYDTGNHWDVDHEENVLPQAIASEKTHPELYQFHDTAIGYVEFNDSLYVVGCRCKKDVEMFTFFEEEKVKILSFYKETQDVISVDDVQVTS